MAGVSLLNNKNPIANMSKLCYHLEVLYSVQKYNLRGENYYGIKHPPDL
jgi:hypothetical protein